MKKQLFSLLLVGLATTAHATNYPGNGNAGFNGAVGNGTLSVTNNAAGAFVFSFTLGSLKTDLGGNDLVIYVDNSKGGGIGTSTASLTDVGDGGRKAVSGFTTTDNTNGTAGRSTLSFGTLASPNFALDLSANNANVYGLVNGGTFTFAGGQTVGGTSQGGVTYTTTAGNGTSTSTVFTATVPRADLGLTNTVDTIKLLGIQVSETGFSSNEATVAVTGNSGFGNTQTIGAVNSFTTTVPEPSTWASLAAGIGALALVQRFRRRSVA